MEAEGVSGAEIDAFESKWVKSHKLVTLDEGMTLSAFWIRCKILTNAADTV
jgi:hypothetical protein